MTEPRTAAAVDWEAAYRELERTLGDMLTGVAAQYRELTTVRIRGLHFLDGQGDAVRIVLETTRNALVGFEVRVDGQVVAAQPESHSNTLTLSPVPPAYEVRAWARRPDSRRVVSITREVPNED